MSVVLGLGSFALLAFPAMAQPLGRKLRPQEWAHVVLTCLGSGALGLELAFVLLAAPTILRGIGVHELAAACERTVGSLAPGGPRVGLIAAAGATVIPVLVGRGMWRATRARRAMRIESTLGTHEPFLSCELVVLPTERLLAMTVPGEPTQIVITHGLVDALSEHALRAVLLHEETHGSCHHDRYLLTAIAIDSGLGRVPLVRRSSAVLRLALERWADERAASSTDAGRAQVHAALERVGSALFGHPAVAAFGTEATLAERLAALDAPSPSPSFGQRMAVYGNATAFGGVAAVGLGLWLAQAQMMLAMSGLCHL